MAGICVSADDGQARQYDLRPGLLVSRKSCGRDSVWDADGLVFDGSQNFIANRPVEIDTTRPWSFVFPDENHHQFG